jgi:ribosome-binding protein aMBF1 (putative translation factor)
MKRTRRNIHTKKRSAGRKTVDALQIIDRITGRNRRLREMISQATVNTQIAEMLYLARKKAGLTQQELAELAGTKQPVIARLEDADYNGHSLTMLQRIAAALNKRIEIRLTSTREKLQHA